MKKKAFIPISALVGALLLALVVGLVSALPFSVQGTAHAQQSASTDTSLFELSLAGGDGFAVSALMPAFAPSQPPMEGGYTAYVANNVDTLTLTANASHTGAVVAVKAGATENAAAAIVVANDGTYPISLGDAGTDTIILVTVAAADTFATATYKVTVMRGVSGSAVTTLSALSLMAGSDKVDISPEFAAGTLDYTASVPYSTTRVEIMATPTARDATAAVKSDKDSNVQNNLVDLSERANVITVTVTAADKATTGDYTVTVTRVENSFSTDTTLAALSLATTTDAIPLAPRFVQGRAPTSSGYTAKVGGSVGSVILTASATHTSATAEVMVQTDNVAAMEADAESIDSPYTVSLRGDGRDTVILVTVTAQDMISEATYKVTVERAALPTSTVTTLSALSLMAGGNEVDIDPSFDISTNDYTANVTYATTRVEVMPTPTNKGATVAVKSDKDNNVQNNLVDLSEGANVITVTVTAADKATTGDYTVRVTRAKSTDPRITTLTALSLVANNDAAVSLMPSFVADRAPVADGHTAYVANDVGALTLTANASHAGAVVAVKAGATENAAAAIVVANVGTYPISLGDAGTDTIILVTVTAADRVAMATYKVTVMRGVSGSAVTTLSALSLMAGSDKVDISPEFAAGTLDYTASVPYSTTRVEIMATPTARDATAAVKSDKDSNVQNNLVDLSEGANVITVTVTAADKATTGDYTVTVTRVTSNLSTDTTLDAFSLADSNAGIELMPEFVRNRAPAEGGYTAEAGGSITEVDVTASAAHTGASVAVMVMGDDDNSQVRATTGRPYAVTLNPVGRNTVILVTVTAADLATTATYRITVSTPAAATDATLKELRLSLGDDMDDVALTPDFDSETEKYRADAEVASVAVVATPTNSEATVTVTSNKDDEVQENVVELAIGTNIITVTVDPVDTTADNVEYQIQVMRRASDDATLSSLMLMGEPMDMMEGASIDLMDMDDMTVEFMADTTMYYASVASDVDKIVVVPMKMHSAAMVSVMYGAGMSADMDAMMVDVESYWNMLGCPAMNDAVGADDQPDDDTSPYCRMYDGLDEDPKMKVDEAYKYHYSVSLMAGKNTVNVMVTAEDGATSQTYTVTVTVGEAPPVGVDLLGTYDADGDGNIDLTEVSAAIDDYFKGELTLEEVSAVIDLYFM